MSETLLPKKQSHSNAKTLCGGLLFVALTGAIAFYSLAGHEQASSSSPALSSRVIIDEVNVKGLAPMKTQWSHFDDYMLELKQLSLFAMEGKLLHASSSRETTFTVNYNDRTLHLASKNFATNAVMETLYSTVEKSLQSETTPVYQFTDSKGVITDGFAGFEKYTSSELLTDTFIISLKLAQYGFSGKSAPVVKGFHSVAQTLARQTKKFTQEMKEVVREINSKMSDEKNKQQESLLWTSKVSTDLFGEKLRYGPCSRYKDCSCEIENRTSTCGNPCFGLCGADCNCWMFVCGDCECHCFCYEHDNYCSCYSIADLHCWNIWLWFDACC